MVDIALAQVAAATDKDGTALNKLLALATDAERRHFMTWTLEAKLAAWRFMRIKGMGASDALRAEVDGTARLHGFGRISRLLQATVPNGQ